MALVTVERYRAITGDQTSEASAVEERIEEATEELAEVLGRPLALGSYTETLYPTRDGMLWPRCTPITAAPGWSIDGYGLHGGSSWPVGSVFGHTATSVTYSGGWTDETVPNCIARDIAQAAKTLGPVDAAGIDVPKGAGAAKVGDVSVTFGPGGAPGSSIGDRLAAVWSRRTLAYRYRVERSV